MNLGCSAQAISSAVDISRANSKPERRDMGALDVLRGDRAAAAVGQVEAVAGVGDEDHVPAHVGARPNRRRDAHVGGYAERDDVLRAQPLQAEIEVRADEGRVDALGDERLALAGLEARAKCVAGVFGASVEPGCTESWRTWMIGRPAVRHASSSARPFASDLIVPAARPGRGVERLLHVDGQEDGAVEIDCHENPLLPAAGPLAHKKCIGASHKGTAVPSLGWQWARTAV